jgi:DNA-binding GntR family transcriptional regulator
MQSVDDIKKPNLSETLASSLREMIVVGRLTPGTRINEVHLCASMGVSRTPLREALMRLVAEGAVVSKARFGFYVSELTLAEFEQTYSIRQLLDPEALRLAGLPTEKQLSRLVAMNEKLSQTSDPGSVIARDNAWHLELISSCPNRILIGLIEQFIDRGRRYELALMRELRNVERTVRDHDDILTALQQGDLTRACEALRMNMESGSEPIKAWLIELQFTQQKQGQRVMK